MDFSRILYSEISFKPATINGHQANDNNTNNNNSNNKPAYQIGNINEDFKSPKQQLCDPNLVKLDWLLSEKVGGGLINVGNTCFLNSVLQCLTYCPPLYNFLVKLNGGHSNSCKINQFCMLCEMEKHIKRIRSSNGGSIKPVSIVQRLKYINKSFQFGRQEDAHEFLRYIIDHMWKACLMNLDINCKNSKIDPRIKETTVINHIFGGYHRSQVLCLTCNSRSNTFDFFMDFILDIRNAKSLEEALRKFTQPETLENENAYKCGKCRKKVTARKKFTVFKAPNVATFQLKRFDSERIFGGKVTKFISYPEELDLRPYMSDPTKSPIKYHLSAVLVHVGHSSCSGHYFCFIKNSNNFWYRMDDSNVSHVTQGTVLQQQAYVLFYTRKTTISDQKYPSNGIAQELNNSCLSTNNNHSANNIKTNNSTANNNTTTAISNLNTTTNILNNTTSKSSDVQSRLLKQTNGTQKITNYFTPLSKNQLYPENGSLISSSSGTSSFSTWYGARSKLDEEDANKRKLNEVTERDKFNEELDVGKMKKTKIRDDRFSNLSKANPFQRFTSNGYQHDYRRHHDSHRNRFRHKGKHKSRNFNRRQ